MCIKKLLLVTLVFGCVHYQKTPPKIISVSITEPDVRNRISPVVREAVIERLSQDGEINVVLDTATIKPDFTISYDLLAVEPGGVSEIGARIVVSVRLIDLVQNRLVGSKVFEKRGPDLIDLAREVGGHGAEEMLGSLRQICP